MSPLFAISGLLLVAAITPGPNNLVVMHAAMPGVRRALPAIAGVLLGGVAMLALVDIGLGTLLIHWPMLRLLTATGGAAYLAWLGWTLARAAGNTRGDTPLPSGLAGLFGFQFLNPKAWVMLLTVTAALPAPGPWPAFAQLAPLFVVISGLCLLIWAVAGHALARHVARSSTRAWIDRALGALLLASALLLFIRPLQGAFS